MTPFDFVFTLFGLLLGFTLVQLLSGLVRAIKWASVRPLGGGAEPVRLGWLTPLLGLFVYWMSPAIGQTSGMSAL